MGDNPNPIGSGPYALLTYDQQKVSSGQERRLVGQGAARPGCQAQVHHRPGQCQQQRAARADARGTSTPSNNFLPGINSIASGIGGYGIQTYYPTAPYMLSANTAWLATNDIKKPMNDKVFRRALAESIDVSKIVNNVYGNIVKAAS
jgi:peptide/nickel transport system substrate-binding protein